MNAYTKNLRAKRLEPAEIGRMIKAPDVDDILAMIERFSRQFIHVVLCDQTRSRYVIVLRKCLAQSLIDSVAKEAADVFAREIRDASITVIDEFDKIAAYRKCGNIE